MKIWVICAEIPYVLLLIQLVACQNVTPQTTSDSPSSEIISRNIGTNIPVRSQTSEETSTKTMKTTTPPVTPCTNLCLLQRLREKDPPLLLSGGLSLACIILTVCTIVLSCKVCQLKKRFRELTVSTHLLGYSEKQTEAAELGERKAGTEAKETTLLIEEAKENKDDATGNAAGDNVKPDGAKEQEKVGGQPNGEAEASTPEGQNSAPEKPQVQPSGSESPTAPAASASADPEEPKKEP